MTRIIRSLPARLLLLLATLSLVGAACGGARSGTGAAGTGGKGAEATPQSVLFFGDANIDTGSSAWQKVEALGARFPGWTKLVGQFEQSLQSSSSNGVDFNRDVRPYVGSEASIAVLAVSPKPGGGFQPTISAYVESKDDAKLEAALQKGGKVQKTGTYKGYDTYRGQQDNQLFAAIGKGALLVATDQQTLEHTIDAREGDAPRLADNKNYQDAIAKLPSDNIAVGYVDGPGVDQLVQLAIAAQPQNPLSGQLSGQMQHLQDQLKALRGVAFSAGATDEGYRFRAVTLIDQAQAKQSGLDLSQNDFSPTLVDRVPADALAYLGFSGLDQRLKTALQQAQGSTAGVQQQLQAFEQQTGLSLNNDILPLLSGEDALYVGRGAQPVSAGLLLKPDDPAQAEATLKKLTALISKYSPGTQFTPVTSGSGEQAQVAGQTVVWRRDGDVIGIGNTPTVGSEPTSKLSDAETYKRLTNEAGTPGKVSSLIYVDVPGLVSLSQAMGSTSTDPQTMANAQHVGPFIAWATSSGDSAQFDAFVEIKK